MNLEKLKSSIENDSIEWVKHVLQRMLTRGVSRSDVKYAILKGELIEDYPDDKPFPSALFFCIINNRPIHAVAALNEENMKTYIITVYEPSLDVFERGYKTRRKR